MNIQNSRGYTLIELIFFIVVVGSLLYGMAYMKWGNTIIPRILGTYVEQQATTTDMIAAVEATTTEATSTPLISAFEIVTPQGGEVFKLGTTTEISWTSLPNRFDYVSLQVVTNYIEDCPFGYTTDSSRQTCRAYEIYTGKNTGTTTWTVGKSISGIPVPPGDYYLRIWPDIGMETSHQLRAEGYDVSIYASTTFRIEK